MKLYDYIYGFADLMAGAHTERAFAAFSILFWIGFACLVIIIITILVMAVKKYHE